MQVADRSCREYPIRLKDVLVELQAMAGLRLVICRETFGRWKRIVGIPVGEVRCNLQERNWLWTCLNLTLMGKGRSLSFARIKGEFRANGHKPEWWLTGLVPVESFTSIPDELTGSQMFGFWRQWSGHELHDTQFRRIAIAARLDGFSRHRRFIRDEIVAMMAAFCSSKARGYRNAV